MNLSDAPSTETNAAHAKGKDEMRALYERLQSLRWTSGFEGAYAACFCALLTSLDRARSVREVTEILPHYEERFALLDFLNAMVNLGFHPQRRRFRSGEAIDTPALVVAERGLTGEGRPFVILGIEEENGARVATVFDGEAMTVRREELANLRELRGGVLYAFKRQKQESVENAALMRAGAGYGWFRTLAIRFYRLFAQILTLSLFINILGLSTPLFIMLVYDRVIAARVTEALPYLVAGVSVAIAADWVLRSIRSHRLAWIAARMDNIVGNLTFSKLTKLPAQTSDNASVTAQLLRLRSFESLRDFFSSAAFMSVMELPFVAIYILAILLLGGPIAAVPIACILAYVVLFVLMRKRIGIDIRRTAHTGAASQRFLLETFAKKTDIQTAGLNQKWAEKYAALSRREFDAFSRLVFAGNLAETLAHAITLVGGVATLSFGALMIFSHQMSAGALIACLILTWRTLTPFHNFCAVIQRFEQIRNSVIQIDALMEIAADEEERTGGAALSSLRGRVAFERVGLQLGARSSPIFMDLSFTAKPGEIIGFTGHSGSGKSLLLKLVQGVYEASFGAVRVDGFDIRQLDSNRLRRMISYIPQQPQLFTGTIEENVRLVRPEATSDEIWAALEMAGAAEQIKALPDGVLTDVTKDRRLSFELLMQISIARAYLLDGKLFLIDELPNSLLMNSAGKRLRMFLRESAGRRSVFIASQNPEMLDLCDRVFEVTSFGLKSVRDNSSSNGKSAMERVA
ncbi:MAG: ATP-binding cassette domain-containing protein [Parvularculaceae bacterium]